MVPKTWRWYATSPSIWSAKSPTSDQSSAAASAPPGTRNTCWTFSARRSQSRVNLDSLPWRDYLPGVVFACRDPERKPMINSTEIARFEPVLLAALRIVAGLLFLSHGLVKLFGFPPGAAPGQQELL